jgi:hypothetical protein
VRAAGASAKPCRKVPTSHARRSERMGTASGQQRAADRAMRRMSCELARSSRGPCREPRAGHAWPPDGTGAASARQRAAGAALRRHLAGQLMFPGSPSGRERGGYDRSLRGNGTVSGGQRVARGHDAGSGEEAAKWSMNPCGKASTSNAWCSGRMGNASEKQRTADRDMRSMRFEQPSSPGTRSGRYAAATRSPPMASVLWPDGNEQPGGARPKAVPGQLGWPGTP